MPILEATGVAASGSKRKEIEQAMTQAAEQAALEGITDTGIIRERMLAARQVVKDRPFEEVQPVYEPIVEEEV